MQGFFAGFFLGGEGFIKGCHFKIFILICRIFSVGGNADSTAVNTKIPHRLKHVVEFP